jgi:hypothetical protein
MTPHLGVASMREALSAITLEDIDRRPAIKINYLEARPACTRRVQTRSCTGSVCFAIQRAYDAWRTRRQVMLIRSLSVAEDQRL